MSRQDIDAAMGLAVRQWLKIADEPARTTFFADIEASVSEAFARKIKRHPLRPAATTLIVTAARKQVEDQNQFRKAEAQSESGIFSDRMS